MYICMCSEEGWCRDNDLMTAPVSSIVSYTDLERASRLNLERACASACPLVGLRKEPSRMERVALFGVRSTIDARAQRSLSRGYAVDVSRLVMSCMYMYIIWLHRYIHRPTYGPRDRNSLIN